mmetsp:Transcript_1027/g.2836  ORF Transcript_1027/g.2836 Transcript_1027/m.2836 type:complete len:326 (+) Transcript_1027:117-1094(+)
MHLLEEETDNVDVVGEGDERLQVGAHVLQQRVHLLGGDVLAQRAEHLGQLRHLDGQRAAAVLLALHEELLEVLPEARDLLRREHGQRRRRLGLGLRDHGVRLGGRRRGAVRRHARGARLARHGDGLGEHALRRRERELRDGEGARRRLREVPARRGVAVLAALGHVVHPLPFEHLSGTLEVELARPLLLVVQPLPLVLVAVGELQHAEAGALAVLPLALVNVAFGIDLLAAAVSLVNIPLALVRHRAVPGAEVHAETLALALDPVAGVLLAQVPPLAHPERALAMAPPAEELALVLVAVGPRLPPEALLLVAGPVADVRPILAER